MRETILLVDEEQNLCVWDQAEKEEINSEEIKWGGRSWVREELFQPSMAGW